MRVYLLVLSLVLCACNPVPKSQEIEQLEKSIDSLEQIFEALPDSIKLQVDSLSSLLELDSISIGSQNISLLQPEIDSLRFFLLQTHGIGFLTGPFYRMNYYARRPLEPLPDSLPLYSKNLKDTIGAIPYLLTGSLYTFRAIVDSAGKRFYYANDDPDRPDGMASWQFFRVYEEREGFVRMFSGLSKNPEVWAKLAELDSNFRFYRWPAYFRQFPNGNEGWQQGYTWIGMKRQLFESPDAQSTVITTFPSHVEVYLTAHQLGDWAEVVIKEVNPTKKYLDTESPIYTNEWKGWIPLVTEQGYPNLVEIILGC